MSNQSVDFKPSDGYTILIVDDNPTNLKVLFATLRDSGFRILAAKNGESAIQRAEYAQPDIILLDVMMPGISGFETCRRLKQNDQTKNIPIIFMTVLDDTIDKVKGFELGAIDYVTKPLHPEEVKARLITHLTVRNLQKSLEHKNARLQQEIAQREELIGELDAFSHTVAHDLQNPLSVIAGYISLLQQDFDDMSAQEIEHIIDKMLYISQKMGNIIKELLLLSGVRKGQIEMRPLNMAQIVRGAEKRLAYMIEEHQAELIASSDWPKALGYGPWIEEIWCNYISNGLKYGGQPPRLELGATTEPDGMITFWVRDNGPGIEADAQKHLFTRFTRLETARAEGHGLGLSIVKRIVEKLNGQVGVKSRPGQGSTFFFTLPAASSSQTESGS